MTSEIAADVRAFYERFPCPEPVDSLDGYRRRWRDHNRRRSEHFRSWPATPYREDHTILVAGCGTSQAAKHALRWPRARVVGIDVSANCVRFTAELKKKYHLHNLELRQLPVERVSELDQTFDHIVCTGVLHHLADPDAGLAALRDVLDSEGAMELMVYAPYGRAGVYMLQEFCKRLDIRASHEGIRALNAALNALPAGHPLQHLLHRANLRHESAFADVLLHPQDRAYSVPQLLDLIKTARLTFARWLRQAPYSLCGVMARIPQAPQLAQLPPAEQYAAAELFRGTMVRHSVIVYRDDRSRPQHVGFAGDAWRSYIPIRLPDTVCIQVRPPPGSVGVLVNRAHNDGDIFMAIDAQEKRMFDAIDGVRTVDEIIGEEDLDAPRAFFERLWRYDQIVFDHSGESQ